MIQKHDFSNMAAVLEADRRAARFLVPPADTPEDRAAANAEAMRALDQAVRALIAADRSDAALKAARLRAMLEGGV